MKTYKSIFVVGLLLSTLLFFVLQYIIFHDPHEAGFLLFQDLAFLPLHVVLVTLFLDKIIERRKKAEKIERINILVSEFFSEVGNDAIIAMNDMVANLDQIHEKILVETDWPNEKFEQKARELENFDYKIDTDQDGLKDLGGYLKQKKDIVLSMFSNPSLLEHDRFTRMLWSLHHLIDELSQRESFPNLPQTDIEHLQVDVERAYKNLMVEWIYYMKNLHQKYPFLFSLAVRKSPFGAGEIVIEE